MSSDKEYRNLMNQIKGSISLDMAKQLMDRIEAYAVSKGLKCVIAICNAHGNPIAVHAMDDSFLVSYEAATQKAYTAVAVKMSTLELNKLVQPGETFYGLESLKGGKMVTFGGGVPLKTDGTIVAGLGISGGTGEQDNDVAEFGAKAFDEMVKA